MKYLVATISLLVVIFGYFYLFNQPNPKQQLVAITQIAPHPSLDAIRKGLIDGLKEGGIDSNQIIFDNALGSIATATQIAQKLVGKKPDVIVPITTPSAQTVYALAKQNKIPVVFAAVSDPVSAKLVPSMTQAGDGITGLSDLSPIEKQVELIITILPGLKKLGVVYFTGEANSAALVLLLEKACQKHGIELIRSPAASSTEVVSAARAVAGRVNAIYVPNDNTVVSALPALLKVANENRLPVFSADPESVERGCLATVSHNQYELGRQTAKIVLRVLAGEEIKNIVPETGAATETVVNLTQAKVLGVTIPKTVLEQSRIVE